MLDESEYVLVLEGVNSKEIASTLASEGTSLFPLTNGVHNTNKARDGWRAATGSEEASCPPPRPYSARIRPVLPLRRNPWIRRARRVLRDAPRTSVGCRSEG
jgi:hypothetical protein